MLGSRRNARCRRDVLPETSSTAQSQRDRKSYKKTDKIGSPTWAEKMLSKSKHFSKKSIKIVDKQTTFAYNIYVNSWRNEREMPITPKEIVKILKKNGFVEVSQKGSHLKLRNEQTGKTVIVPMHSKELPLGTEQAILKQAGLK